MPRETPTVTEVEQPIVAISFPQLTSGQDWNRLFEYLKDHQIKPVGLHFETASFLLNHQDGQKVATVFGGSDVTDSYRELKSKTDGYRIVRVGKDPNSKARVIKNYSAGVYCMFSESGNLEAIVPNRDESAVYFHSGYITIVETPLRFFNSLEEAKVADTISMLSNANSN